MGLDAVLDKDVYLATSEGEKINPLKPKRRKLADLKAVQTKKNAKRKGSRARRKLAQRERGLHARIAKSRQDFQYQLAHHLVRSGKKVFFGEKLDFNNLTKRNHAKWDELGKPFPNGQSAKSGLNQSWLDAAFGQFFSTLTHIGEKAGAVVVENNPAYTSQILSYRDEFVFTD